MTTRIFMHLVAVLALLVSACAGSPEQPAETLEQRVQGRWDALVSQDFETAYQYFSPGMRQTVRFQDFLRQMFARTVAWTDAKFEEVSNCDGDACKVAVNVFYRVRAPAGAGEFKSVQVLHENWIRSAGQWYFVPRDAL